MARAFQDAMERVVEAHKQELQKVLSESNQNRCGFEAAKKELGDRCSELEARNTELQRNLAEATVSFQRLAFFFFLPKSGATRNSPSFFSFPPPHHAIFREIKELKDTLAKREDFLRETV